MSDEIKDGEATEPIAEQSAFGPDEVKKMIAEAVGQTTKEWQSRFDKVVSEKKATESKAMTVEERLANMEAERQAERVAWARKEARAKAGIDESLEAVALGFASSDPETISKSADQLKAFFDERESTYKKQIAELEKKLQFGAKSPVGGGGSQGIDFSKMSLNEITKYAMTSPEAKEEVLAWQKSR
jgi:uncharacterized protein YydD (DUF2326 family)